MKKYLTNFILIGFFASNLFAYNDPYICSLQNLFNQDSCKSDLVPQDDYNCFALPNIRVNGEPVCVVYY